MAKDKTKLNQLTHYCYLITNHINNKVYVGVTHKNINDRFDEHIKVSRFKNSNKKQAIHLAMAKHGISNFFIQLLEKFDNAANAYGKEVNYISQLNSTSKKYGYNQSAGGDRGPIKIKYDEKLVISIINDLCNGVAMRDIATKHEIGYYAVFDISRLKISSTISLPQNILDELRIFKAKSNKRKRVNVAQIAAIITDFVNDSTMNELSKKYKLSNNNIWNIVHRNTWSNLDIGNDLENKLKAKLSLPRYWRK